MKSVFVTVGSTSFDELSHAVLSKEFLDELCAQDYTLLVLQHGNSGKAIRHDSSTTLDVRLFSYAPNLSEEVNKADLIISHAGAGSIIEALRAKKRLIVVANEGLMDNHQVELARKLTKDEFCASASPANLPEALRRSDTITGKALPPSDGSVLSGILKHELAVLSHQ